MTDEKETVGTAAKEKGRLDVTLVARGLVRTRSHARDAIKRGSVEVNGAIITKPGLVVAADVPLRVLNDEGQYVSRGALKLLAGLDAFGFEVRGRICLDIGASTGGFTQVLIDQGADHVCAVDIGQDQLHDALRAHPRVTCLDGMDARHLTPDLLRDNIGAITADVSFISLTKSLIPALRFAAPGAWLIALVKPQFEVGPEKVGKGGIVKSAEDRQDAVKEIRAWLNGQPGWHVTQTIVSPIAGRGGNLETLVGATYYESS